MMKMLQRFLSLFHRKQRFKPQHQNLSFLKKWMFICTAGFIVSLSLSKFIYSDLIFSFQPNQTNKLYIKLNPSLQRGVYLPSMFMFFGVFQRWYAKYREEEQYLKIQEEEIQGNSLKWVLLHDKSYQLSQKKQKQIPVVIVITGSEGVNNTIRAILLASYSIGYRVVALQPADLYDLNNIQKVLKNLKDRFPHSKLLGIGVEYGANLLINYASKNRDDFSGLVSIGNPFDLSKSQISLQQSWIWKELYNSILKGKIKKIQNATNKIQPENTSLFQLQKEQYNVQQQQYINWKQQNSCINHIKDVKVPTLFLQSKEDPFTQDIQGDQRFQNDKCLYVTTKRGGHNEWFQNLWMNRWFVTPIKGFLKLVVSQKVEKIVQKNQMKQNSHLL